VTIPLNISHNFREQLQQATHRVCFSGFGVGLTWLSMVMDLGPLTVSKVLDYEPT